MIKKLTIFILIVLLLSCKKNFEEENENISTIERMNALSRVGTLDPFYIYDYLMTQADGVFYLSSYGSYSLQQYDEPRLNCSFKSTSITKTLPSSINQVSLYPFNTRFLKFNNADLSKIKNLFGQSVNIKLNYQVNGNSYASIFNQIITEPIKMPTQNISKVFPSKKITWVSSPDNSESEYVLFSLSFDPRSAMNSQFYAGGMREKKYRNIVIEDVGTYTITQTDLSDFPINASLILTIYRGNISLPTDNVSGKKFFIGSYSSIAFGTINTKS